MVGAWLAAAALAAGCDLPTPPQAPAPAGPIAVGNANNLFLIVPAGRGEEAAFSYRQRDAAGAWHAPGVGEGAVAAAAAWREHVLVFFPTGRYGLFGLETPTVQPAPAPAWTPAAVAEDGAAIDAFGWAADEPTHARNEGGAWTLQKIDIPLRKETVHDPSAARFRDRLFLAWREEVPALARAGSTWRLGFAYGDAAGWKGPYPPPGQPGLAMESAPRIAATADLLLCLYRAPAGGGRPAAWALAAYSTGDENWHENTRLEGISVDEPLTLARWREGFCVATVREGHPCTASLEGQPLRIGPFQALKSGERREWLPGIGLPAILLGLLLVAALVVASRRHGRAMRDAGGAQALSIAKQAAPIGRRVVAGAIDQVLLTLPLAAGILYLEPDLLGQWPEIRPWPDEQMLLVQLVRFLLTVLYFTLGEWLAGRTLGKALAGLEVRSLGGARLRPGQALIRNLARAVDEIPFPLYAVGLVSIYIGPLPQRLGDRMAGALVVTSSSSKGL